MPYETLDMTGQAFKPMDASNEYYVNARNPESLETFRRVIKDTNTGIRAHNALLKEFPELFPENTKPIKELPEYGQGIPEGVTPTFL